MPRGVAPNQEQGAHVVLDQGAEGVGDPVEAEAARPAGWIRERAGLSKHTFHGLRHDFGSLLLAAGVPGRVVMEMMGHSSYVLTANPYQHVPDALQREAADRLDQLFAHAE